MGMNSGEIKKRFVEEIKLRAYDDRYIDLAEEKEILQIAIQEGIGVDSARSLLRQACEQQGYVIESLLNEKAKTLLEQFASNDGSIDKKEFDDTVGILFKAAQNRLSQAKCQKKVKALILDNEWKVKEGFMKGGKWFSEI